MKHRFVLTRQRNGSDGDPFFLDVDRWFIDTKIEHSVGNTMRNSHLLWQVYFLYDDADAVWFKMRWSEELWSRDAR